MKYRVIFQPRALQNLEEQYQHIAKQNAAAAAKWFNQFVAALDGLAHSPERCGIARESELAGGKFASSFLVSDLEYAAHFS